MAEAAPPRVFISYSHDSAAHQNRVLGLADRLRADGIDAIIDQYVQFPPEGWPAWCDAEIQKADFVLMVCTKTYLRRADREEQPGKGHGVLWEARLIKQHLYDAGSASGKLVPALLADGSHEHVPLPMRGGTIYPLETQEGYESLLRLLTDQPLTPMPPLGQRKQLPPRDRQTFGSAENYQVKKVETQLRLDGEVSSLDNQIATFQFLCGKMSIILNDNRRIFEEFGPKSAAAANNMRWDLSAWHRLRGPKIVPANRILRDLIHHHFHLIPAEHVPIFRALLSHIDAFEAHVNDPDVDYRDHQFPTEIEEIIARNTE